ncbi:hypothetical protein Tco_1481365 [Tanacetum coccineum]
MVVTGGGGGGDAKLLIESQRPYSPMVAPWQSVGLRVRQLCSAMRASMYADLVEGTGSTISIAEESTRARCSSSSSLSSSSSKGSLSSSSVSSSLLVIMIFIGRAHSNHPFHQQDSQYDPPQGSSSGSSPGPESTT